MSEYEYEVVFSYENTYIGTIVWIDEPIPDVATQAAIRQIWETNGIDIDTNNCVSVKVAYTGMIGG